MENDKEILIYFNYYENYLPIQHQIIILNTILNIHMEDENITLFIKMT